MPRPPRGRGIPKSKKFESARRPLDYDDLMQDGVKQEEQGERYQHGPKAQRHYTHALELYKQALGMRPEDFDARYNTARLLFILATEFESRQTCLSTLDSAITSYETALNLDPTSIDGQFNLAQALVAKAEMLSEGVAGFGSQEAVAQILLRAETLFAVVEEAQTRELANNPMFGEERGGDDLGTQAEADVEDGEGGNAADASESFFTTPSVIIDTILSLLSVYISLYEHGTPDDRIRTRTAIEAAISRADSLDQKGGRYRTAEIKAAGANAVFSLLEDDFSTQDSIDLSSPPFAPALATLVELSDAADPSDPEPLSDRADASILLSELRIKQLLSLPQSGDAQQWGSVAETFKTSLSIYHQVENRLNLRIGRLMSVPAHHVASLTSDNLIQRAYVSLMTALIPGKGKDPSEPILAAESLAQQAFQGLKQTSRTDWRIQRAILEAIFSSLRITVMRRVLGISKGPDDTGGAAAAFAREGGNEEDLRRMVEATRDDTVAKLIEAHTGTPQPEQVIWNEVFQIS